MVNVLSPASRGFYSHWFEVMRSLALGQWRLMDAQYQGSLDFLKSLADAREIDAGPAPPAPVPTAPAEPGDLESLALERVRKGFPPPREVYDVQNRSRIDWSRFPEWAWPTDPDLFTGTAHEG